MLWRSRALRAEAVGSPARGERLTPHADASSHTPGGSMRFTYASLSTGFIV